MTKILLVEDDKSLREIYGVRLLAEGYDIISAGDGEEALAMAIKDRPTLIVSDVMMPKISGFDMLDILRSTTETRDIKVIMMTALSSDDQRQRGVALGADRYLVKSQVGIEDVVRTVHEVLGDAPTTSGAAPSAQPSAPAAPSPSFAIPPRPEQSQAPTPPTPQPSTPPSYAQSFPSPQPAADAPSSLPQPTAPFSTPRPANLGDRVIHPLEQAAPPTDFSNLMKQELDSTPPPAPTSAPDPAPSTQASPAPQAPEAPVQPPTPTPPMPTPSMPIPSTPPPTPAPQPPQPQQPVAAPAPETPLSSGLSFEETPPRDPGPAPQPAPINPSQPTPPTSPRV